MDRGSELWAETADATVKDQLRAWSDEVERRGKDAITRGLPAKVLELNEMLLSGSSSSPFAAIPVDLKTDLAVRSNPAPSETAESDVPDRKKRKRGGEEAVNGAPDGTDAFREARYTAGVESNATLDEVQGVLRKQYEELIDLTDRIKVWINGLIPRIEDNTSFGVQVQEDCLNELTRAQESGYNLLEGQLKYHERRAKLASKLIKYPNVIDYQLALKEFDRKTLYIQRQHLLDLRNIYALVTDLLQKNYNKICKPKTGDPQHMY